MLRGSQCEGEELVDGNQFTASSPAAAVASQVILHYLWSYCAALVAKYC